MSTFVLKLIAIIAMAIDHVGLVFGVMDGWGLLSDEMGTCFRYIGRITFPIIAFLLVNGITKTRSQSKYMSRLGLFAAISQIPYTMATSIVNLMHISSSESLTFRGYYGGIFPVLIVIALWLAYRDTIDRSSYIVIFAALVISALSIKSGGIWLLLSDNLNVLFTLAVPVTFLSKIDLPWKNSARLSAFRQFCQYSCFILMLIFISSRSNYGMAGFILIAALFLLRENKYLQCLSILIWSFVFYGLFIGNMENAVFCSLSIPFILLYNKQKGPSLKYFFYAFYPAHLFILGLFNSLYRLNRF